MQSSAGEIFFLIIITWLLTAILIRLHAALDDIVRRLDGLSSGLSLHTIKVRKLSKIIIKVYKYHNEPMISNCFLDIGLWFFMLETCFKLGVKSRSTQI